MWNYFARFDPLIPTPTINLAGPWLRYDTRIYIDPVSQASNTHSPMASIVAKNPGSAAPLSVASAGTLAPLNIGKDKLLPSVRNAFIAAIHARNRLGLGPVKGEYVQVLNLFYVCDPIISQALRLVRQFNPANDPAENLNIDPVWFSWGGNDPQLNPFKCRFLHNPPNKCIYWDYSTRNTVVALPSVKTSVKHTQGMPLGPITNPTFIDELAKLL
jgi:hypothetical protein